MNITKTNAEQYCTLSIATSLMTAEQMDAIYEQVKTIFNTEYESVIIDLKDVEQLDAEALPYFAKLHHEAYDHDKSLAYACPHENVLKKLKQEQLHLLVNICPTQIEAVDIVSMEMLERDLMKEEE